MKRKMMKKVVSLLLSVTMAAGMNGIQADASNRSGTDGIQADALNRSGTDGVPADGSRIDGGSEEYAAEDVFTVTIDGETTAYQNAEDIARVWQEVQGRTAEIHLLEDIDISKIEFKSVDNHDDMLYTMYMESGNITFSMEEGVKLYNNTHNQVVIIKSGTFTLKSGEISSIYDDTSNMNPGIALTVAGGSVFIRQGAKLSGYNGILVYGNPTVRISGGTFQGTGHAIKCDEGLKIKDILAEGYEIKKGDNQWIDSLDDLDSLTQNAPSDPLKNLTVKGRPVEFNPHPSDQTFQYGSDSQVLYVNTAQSDPSQINNSEINYKWYKAKDNSNPIDGELIADAAGKEYKLPNRLRVGTHLYYCQASGSSTDGKTFAVRSDPAIINVQKKPVTPVIQGTLDKEYDETTSVPPDLTIHLEGAFPEDQVTVTASSLSYESAEEGRHKIRVSGIEIKGRDAENYILSNTDAEAEGTILPPGSLAIPVTGISLDQNELTLAPGGTAKLTAAVQPENASNQRVTWTSDDPDVASVDGSGVVTAVRTGKAVITVTTEVGHYSDSCTVTVKKENNSQGSSSGSNTGGSSGSQNVGWSSGSNGLGGGSTVIFQKQPYLKGSPETKGWSAIRAAVEKAAAVQAGGIAVVDMNSTVLVPGSMLTAIRGKNFTVQFEMGDGMVWSVNGNDIEAQKLNDTDFSVKIASGSIPQEVIDAAAAGRPHLELDFAHSGEFGFTAALSYCIGKAAGSGVWVNGQQSGEMYANLFAYDPLLRRLDFVCAGKVGDDGTVSLPLSRASDGTLILSDAPMGGNETPPQLPSVPPEGTVPENPQEPGETEPAQVKSVKLSKTVYTYNGKAKKPSVIAVDTDGRRISSRYYKVSYKNNQKVGKATAEITFSGGYTGKVKKTFTIRPAGTSIKRIKADPAGFTVTWKKKTAQTNGCQVQYSLDADFKGSSTHSRFTQKASQTKKSVKRLEAGKTYYVRIRTYKAGKTGGKSAWTFSGWSSAVRVKCLGTQGAVGY